MKKDYGFKVEDEVKLKKESFGRGKILEILPLGSHGKAYKLARVAWTTDGDFDFAILKTFALRDLVKS